MNLITSRALTLDASGGVIDRIAGSVFILDTLSAGASVDVTWLDDGGNEVGFIDNVLVGRRLIAGGIFGGYRISGGTPGASVGLYIGPAGADAASVMSQSVVIGHVIVDSIPETEVKNDAGNPLTVREALGATLADAAPVAVDDVGVVVVAADATRREVRLLNVGVNPVALVASNATAFADAATVIQAGEEWIEATAAACLLRAKCAAGLASTLNIQTVSV